MSGVVVDGQQWEHCNKCARFVRFPQDLGYEVPTEQYNCGRDLCVKCVDAGIRAGEIRFEDIVPAPSWLVTEEIVA